MNIIIKKLQGGECNLDVVPTTTVAEIKHQISQKLNIRTDEQKLLLGGRTLADDQTVQSYPTIKDGTKLMLVVKKPEGFSELMVKYFRNTCGMSELEAIKKTKQLLVIIQEKFNRMSWDDVDRMFADCMSTEAGDKIEAVATNVDQDGYGL